MDETTIYRNKRVVYFLTFKNKYTFILFLEQKTHNINKIL